MSVNEELLQKHFENNRYRVRQIWDEDVEPTDPHDNPMAMMMFADSDTEAMAEIERRSPTTAEAMRRNDQNAERREADLEARAQEILAKSERGERLTNEERGILVRTHHAYNVYDDPDSNAPTGIVITDQIGDGKHHADWEHEEGLARIGL